MTLPSFVFLGAQRAGTTWLFNVLTEHPDVFLPDMKEVHLFRGWGQPSLFETHGMGFYEEIFAGTESRLARGDISPGLLAGDGVAELMARHLPECRLIVILRNPVDRAISHFNLVSGRTRVPYSLNDLVRGRVNQDPHEILVEGFYARHLRAFLNHYPKEQILTLFYEDLVEDPEAFYQRVCDFIQVSALPSPLSLYSRPNPPYSNRVLGLYTLNRDIGTFLFLHRFNSVRRAIKRIGLPGLLRKLNQRSFRGVSPDKDTRLALYELYCEDTLDLERLTGRDLSGWLGDAVCSSNPSPTRLI